MGQEWQELRGGILVTAATADRALVNTGLVVGLRRALVIDTGCGPRHGAELLAAVRRVTPLPLVVANTHAHWDHFFGNAVFKNDGATQFWAHATAARGMAATGEAQRQEVAGVEPGMAAGEGPLTELVPPTCLVGADPAVLDLGGVSATLFTMGPAHTGGDLMVGVEGVLFAGDVLEEGAEPQFGDADRAGWIRVLRTLSGMGAEYPQMVPGHGKPVTAAFAAHMADSMEAGPGPARPGLEWGQ
ncbi:glyoxylase-like metal-dependent hydrolase (beta-lactamase superfamily II) [Arthrobacter silviterrae]|uniref:MBL fold metallo-hydrolase n=1 Tax=Arthrobacter silviterrae TaxID=2026658 RepID=A0ABX0DA88_9MICC|nr:MBL fold metallo-hydrolase [Arthrobacter silviterrae]MDQ0277800.1 glyoxylase-like metal-dependent hydrolase (beta-lactamase superfamily II) [Arthrobacter silviterrae]NGN83834.1 MBL fold metallo-hydrolase [Arthrobacter silviterrae]